MPENEEKLELSNLVDMKLLQEFQDSFAETMNFASVTIDDKGPITKPSNFTDFYTKYIEGNATRLKKYNECHFKYGKIAVKKDEYVIYTCDPGLTEFIAPIIVRGNHIGSILGGQVLTEPPNEDRFRKVAKKLGINEDEYIKALRKINVVSMEIINKTAHLLFSIANTISDIALKNLELIKKNELENSLRKIFEAMRGSLDSNEIKKTIVNELGKALDTDSCSIVAYDSRFDYFYLDEYSVYLLNPKDESLVGENEKNPKFKWFIDAFRNNLEINLPNIDEFIAENNLKGMPEESFLEEKHLKSIYGVPINYVNNLLGYLIITYKRDYKVLDENDLDFLRVLATQAGVAINLANSYKKMQLQAEREKLIADITTKAMSTLDINEIKKMVKDIGITMKADRCYFVEPDTEKQGGKPIDFEGEYLVSPDIKSIIGYEFPPEDVKKFFNLFVSAKDLVVFDYEKIREENNEEYQGIIRYSTIFNLKSGIGVTFFHMGIFAGLLAIEYVKEKVLPSEDELDFLRILGNQIGMVYKQIKLYDDTKRTAERESSLRKIFEAIRGSLDNNIIKRTIVNEVGKALSVNTCFIVTYDAANDYFYVDEYSEYRSSPEEMSLIGADEKSPKFKWFVDKFRNNQEIIYPNVKEFIVEHNLQGTHEEGFLKESRSKSSYNIPIYYGNSTLGYICVGYTKDYKTLDKNDLDFLRSVATQAGVAINQANLYKKMKLQAEREKFGRNIIEILRNATDKTTIKNLFVKNIGKYFNADRVFFSDFDPKINMYLPVDKYSEYLSSPEEKSFIGYNWSDDNISEYIQPLIEKRELKILCWDEYIKGKAMSHGFISRFEDANVKSSYNFPVLYQQTIMGYFCIEFTSHVVRLSDADIINIRSICAQAGIALYHSELFSQIQESFKNNNQNHG